MEGIKESGEGDMLTQAKGADVKRDGERHVEESGRSDTRTQGKGHVLKEMGQDIDRVA